MIKITQIQVVDDGIKKKKRVTMITSCGTRIPISVKVLKTLIENHPNHECYVIKRIVHLTMTLYFLKD